MIYLVTANTELFANNVYKIIGVDESLSLLSSESILQADSETLGLDCHLGKLLTFQLGSSNKEWQIVIDCTTIDIRLYKEILESKYLVFQNAKFDLQWLYNYNIIPRKIYDTMIVEQLLYLGYPKGIISYSLKSIGLRRLNIDIDKSVRGQIQWKGLCPEVIKYAADDVVYLCDIMKSQLKDCKEKQCLVGAKLECDVVPAMAYLEWCGIKLDEDKWKDKMKKDKENLDKATEDINNFVIKTPSLSKFHYYENSLFPEYCGERVTVNWSSSKQVIEVAKILGFDTKVQDKETGEDKDSVIEKHLKTQKGINDEFLDLYFKYQEYSKVVSSFGQGHLDSINPITGRLHTSYQQLGTISGRMSCGNKKGNADLDKYKHLPKGSCKLLNMQQLPNDEVTRACFISEKENLFVSCDYSAQEGRVQGDIYQDEAILKMYREGIDGHSMYAKIFFKEELKDIDVHDVKRLRSDLRSKAKSPEFALAYGGGYTTIMEQLKCSEEEAKTILKNYEEGFKGTIEFAKKGLAFVKRYGYISMNKLTGHRLYWWDHSKWLERQKSFTSEFWETYKRVHKGTKDEVEMKVKNHFKTLSKYGRLARNAPAQGTSSIMTKDALISLFNWVIDNNYFNKIKLVNVTHDETNWEFPKELSEFPKIVQKFMEESAAKYCKSLPIPAEASVGEYWIH